MTNRNDSSPQPPPSSSLLEAALGYAARGWPVFPLVPGGKKPANEHGSQDGSTDEATIRGWWTTRPQAGVGIATGQRSGILGLDVDVKKADGRESLRELEAKYGPLPDTPEVLTPSGGRHVYLRMPPGVHIGNSESRLGPSLDIRANGGYLVAPPTRLADGGAYVWEITHALDDLPLATPPDWLLTLLTNGRHRAARRLPERIAEGARNAALASVAGSMRHRGVSEGAILAALQVMNADQCDPPLGDGEVARIASSVAGYAPGAPGGNGGATEPVPELVLPFVTGAELWAKTPETPDWVVQGLLARKCITDMSAKIKVGKTTFVMAMIKAILTGSPFLGFKTAACPVLYMTEEREQTIREVLGRVGIEGHADLHILFRHSLPGGLTWERAVSLVTQKALEVGAGVVVVDTLTRWAGVQDENDAAEASRAMTPLDHAAGAGLAISTVRHDRKSGGEIGDSARGSSAYGGGADILLALRRANAEGHENRRELEGVGRFDATPEKLIIEFANGEYRALGDASDVEQRELRAKVLDRLPSTGAGWMEEEVSEKLGGSRSTIKRVLGKLMEESLVHREKNAGKRGTAYGYLLSTIRMDPEQLTKNHASYQRDLSQVSRGMGGEQLVEPTLLFSPHSIDGQLVDQAADDLRPCSVCGEGIYGPATVCSACALQGEGNARV